MIVEVPRKIKYGRIFKFKKKKYKITRAHNFISNYKIGLKVLETKRLRYFHLKSIIMVLKNMFKKQVKYKVNISFCYPITRKSEQSRMGKGKGKRSYWAAYIEKGAVILEIHVTKLIPDINLLNSLLSVSYKLPFKCKFVKLVY